MTAPASTRRRHAPAGWPLPLLMAVWGAACLGGAASLIHEVAWSRLFTLAVGSSADSATVILMGFMGGFGAGAWLAGRLERRILSPMLALLAAQLVLALLGFFIVPLVGLFSSGSWASLLAGGGPAAVLLARILFSLVLVTLPATLMGLSLPLMLGALSTAARGEPGAEAAAGLRRAGALLITLSTAGAAAGALLAGYLLIPNLGLRLTCRTAALLSAASALLAALVFVLYERKASPKPPPGEAPRPAQAAAASAGPGLIEVASFAAGFYLLAMEIVWRRVLVLSFGHDTYGMSAMLLMVITGLALGSAAGTLLLRFFPTRARLLAGLVMLLASVAAPVAMVLVLRFLLGAPTDPFGLVGVPSLSSALHGGIFQQLLVSALVIGAPAVLAGAILPVLCGELRLRAGETSRPLARLLLANYAGSLLGAALAAFLLIGLLGIHGSTLALSLLLAAAGAALLGSAGGRRARRIAAGAGAIAAVALFLLPSGLPRKLFLKTSGGTFLTALFYKEGRTSTVGVTKDGIDGERQLLINGVNEVSTRFVHDQSFALLGHLGMLLHPDPRDVLIVSFGAGISPGAAAAHHPSSIEAVDLERDVLEAASWFSDLSDHVLDKPFLHPIIEDGRFYLLTTAKNYDVMIIDSTHPRSVDSWLLYTRQFFESVRSKLRPDGIVVQWVPMHGMSDKEFKIILATFLATFPEGQLWANAGYDARGFSGYALMVGSPSGKIVIDTDRVEARLKEPAVKKSLARWLLSSLEAVLGCFITSGQPLRAWTKGLPILDDDNPIIPFVTPWSKSRRVHPSMLTEILEAEGPPLKAGAAGETSGRFTESLPLRYLSMGHLLRGDLVGALEKAPDPALLARYDYEKRRAAAYFKKLVTLHMDDERSLLAALSSLRGLGAIDEVLPLLGKAAKACSGRPEALFEIALSYEFAGDEETAIMLYGQVLRLQPEAVPAMNNLALLLARQGQYKEALTLLMQSRLTDPWHDRTWVATGRVQMMRKEFDLALEAFRRAEALSPDDPQIQNSMGLALSGMGDFEKATKRFQRALRLDPFWEEPAFNAGFSCFSLKKYEEAALWFERALALSPGDAEFWRHLGMALAAGGQLQRAIDAYLAALRIDPQSDLAWLYLGFAYKNLKMEEDARIAFEYALRLNPELAQSILTLAPPPPAGEPMEKPGHGDQGT